MLNPPNRRGTDPYARWCGRGGVARRPPIPIDPAPRRWRLALHVVLVSEAATQAALAHQNNMDAKRRADETQSSRRDRSEAKKRPLGRLTAARGRGPARSGGPGKRNRLRRRECWQPPRVVPGLAPTDIKPRYRHARPCAGHPRRDATASLRRFVRRTACGRMPCIRLGMAGTRPAMTAAGLPMLAPLGTSPAMRHFAEAGG
jgi:hypothetical protein